MKITPWILALFFSTVPLLSHARPAASSDDLVKNLVKVTGDSNQKCVEYYNYNGGMYCSTKAINQEVIDPTIKDYEKQTIVFDQRPWQAAWGKNDANMIAIEYVPIGDNINHWNELITSQFFPNLQTKATPKAFASYIVNNMKKSGYDPMITVHQDTPDQFIFEFRIVSPSNQMQDEIQKITSGKDGFYVLHYVIKKADMGNDNRKLWVSNLSKSTIKK